MTNRWHPSDTDSRHALTQTQKTSNRTQVYTEEVGCRNAYRAEQQSEPAYQDEKCDWLGIRQAAVVEFQICCESALVWRTVFPYVGALVLTLMHQSTLFIVV